MTVEIEKPLFIYVEYEQVNGLFPKEPIFERKKAYSIEQFDAFIKENEKFFEEKNVLLSVYLISNLGNRTYQDLYFPASGSFTFQDSLRIKHREIESEFLEINVYKNYLEI